MKRSVVLTTVVTAIVLTTQSIAGQSSPYRAPRLVGTQ